MDKIRDRAWKLARRTNSREMADDFAQDASLALWLGRKASLKHLLIDFLRTEYGKSDTATGDLARAERLHWVKLDEEGHEQHRALTHSLEWRNLLDGLESKERVLLVLYFEWELELHEIGHCFGVSESRVSQMMTALKAKLSKRRVAV